MRRKVLAGILLLSMTASSFSSVVGMNVNAAEYEENPIVATEETVSEEVVEDATVESAEDASAEVVSEDVTEISLETASQEEELVADDSEDELIGEAEEEIVSAGTIVDSGEYGTWEWSLDEDGLLLVEGEQITMPNDGWPWRDNGVEIKSAKVSGTGYDNIGAMFGGCENLISLDVSGFDTSNVTDMGGMFAGCSVLTNLNLSNFDTSKVTDMSSMFSGCSELTILDISSFDTSNVTSMGASNILNTGGMFEECSSLASLDVSGFDTSNVTYMGVMFKGCSSLTSLDVSGFDTSNVTYISGMFEECSSLTSLDVSDFDTGNVESLECMFNGCKGLTSLDVSNFNTSNVKNMRGMFSGCSGLTSLDVSSFDTSNATYMDRLFSGCSGLTSLDVSSFDTSNVTWMVYMFLGCSSLTSLDVSSFNTSNVTSMADMFAGCSSLTNLDVSNFDTSNVKNTRGMFKDCSGLTSLNVTGVDTSNVKDMESMFWECSGLTSLDVSGFDMSNVTDTSHMFYGCNSLTNLDVSGFDMSSVTTGGGMLSGCNNLINIKSPYNISVDIKLPFSIDSIWLDEDGNVVSSMYQNLTSSVTYQRKNAKLYDIYFHGNGAASGNVSGLYNCIADITYTLPTNTFTRTGFLFNGWNTAADGSGTAYVDGAQVSNLTTENGGVIILYAQWKPITYTIHFDKNTATAGSMSRIYPKYGRYYRLPACGFQKTGYLFAGWNTKKDGTGTLYRNQSNIRNLTTVNGKVVILYAQWRKISVATASRPRLANSAAGRLTVAYDEVSGADGYLIQYSTNKNMAGAKNVSSTTIKRNIYGLKKGTTYYVRVRAYRVDSAGKRIYGKFGSIQYKKIIK